AFVVSAACFWAACYWLKTGPRALGTYLAGHFVMLWGLGLEVLGWAERTSSTQDLASIETTSISILIAGYAVLLVSIGVLSRSAVNRILGLVLIGVVVAKLYLYDVWLLHKVFRVAAFAAL